MARQARRLRVGGDLTKIDRSPLRSSSRVIRLGELWPAVGPRGDEEACLSAADVIINIVSRQRDPAPSFTIMTSEAEAYVVAPEKGRPWSRLAPAGVAEQLCGQSNGNT